MARVKIALPELFKFSCIIPVRVTDINYGGHLGNDRLLGIIHEARVRFLQQFNYSELSVEGAGLIMTDVAIEFKNEAFQGDNLIISVAAGDFQRVGFDLYYRVEKKQGEKVIPVAAAKTGMVCFDYTHRKIVPVPQAVIATLQ